MSPLAYLLRGVVRVYQVALSPLIGRQCRFLPTCSHYAMEALEKHGGVKGGWLAAKRIARCHPFAAAGYDPVPGTVTPPSAPKAAPAGRENLP
jgi:putative membrane protein insertion efficiency factor